MKMYRTVVAIMVLLFITSGLAFAQGDWPEPRITRPPLVACVKGENVPCSEIVNQVSNIVGTWRGYIDGRSAIGFTVFTADGGFGTTQNPQTQPVITSTIRFTDELAFVAAIAGDTVPAGCVNDGVYIMRLIRIGERPVALTRRPLIKDNCTERAEDFSEPMLYYTGTGEDLPKPDASVNLMAQALVPCPAEVKTDAEAYPCDIVANQPTDFVGIWTQYLVPPLTGAAFLRFNTDSSWLLAGTPEDTTAVSTSFAIGTVGIDQAVVTFHEPNDTVECTTGTYYVHVIQWGRHPVALSYTAIKDDCALRYNAWTDPLIWIKGL
ncbi:MAG: hypothetical protein H0X30_23410 [Anaerolineae bacterium]|nr:hypothetical protein [Anaerolineae bacterium]